MVLIAVTRGWRYAAPLALVGALPAAAYATIAWRHGWPALPAPILLTQRLLGVQALSWHGAADLLGGGALTVLVNAPSLLVLELVAVALLATPRADAGNRRERESRYLLLVFVTATLLQVQFGRVGWMYRYEAYLIVLGVVATAAGIAHRWPSRWPRFDAVRWGAAAILAALVLHPLVLRMFLASRDAIDGSRELFRHEYQWSRFFQRYPPAGGLLVGDVGAIAYFTDVPIVDSGGLATLELLPAGWSDRIDVPRAARAARARGVRVSIIDGPQGGASTGWRCVAAWTTVSDSTANGTIWLSAADEEAAAHLAHDLRVFAAGHPDAEFSIRFADDRGHCQAR